MIVNASYNPSILYHVQRHSLHERREVIKICGRLTIIRSASNTQQQEDKREYKHSEHDLGQRRAALQCTLHARRAASHQCLLLWHGNELN